ncbi:MAG: M1 family aminopeptidase, partial [Planctomycetota bacterium]
MAEGTEFGLGCGRRALFERGGDREAFALPGTERKYAPDRAVDVEATRLEVRLDPAVTAVEGTVRHRVRALRDQVERVRFHARELEILAIEDGDGTPLDFRHEGDDVDVHLASPLAAGDGAGLVVDYRGRPRRGLYFIRPDEAYPDKPVQAWTQGQDEDSRHWFPCFDHPSEKAAFEVLARVPAPYQTLSNGALLEKTPHGDGTVTWHWKQDVAHSAYLTTLVVGEFDEVTLADRPVPLTAYVPRGRAAEAERAFGRTPAMVGLFEERFGVAYPYEKYAQVVVSDFIFGGMENTTATTLIEYALYDDRAALDYDADDLIAHELAHQWWGDLLTCRDWSHAWLNEGFATWSENVFKEAHRGQDEAIYDRHVTATAYVKEDAAKYRRAIVDDRYDEPIDLFDRHLYEKGSWVLHMLRRELGEEPFWRAICAYATANHGRSVVTDDLRRAIEDATGRNFEWFFDQWVFKGGHPELKFGWSYDADDRVLSVSLRQQQKGDEVTPEVYRATVDVDVEAGDGVTRHRLDLSRREQTFALPMAEAPKAVRFDPRGWLLCTVEIDRPPSEHRRVLASDAEVMARVRAAKALAKDTAPVTVEALGRALHDPFWGVAAEAAGALGEIRTPAARDALVEALDSVEHPKARRRVAEALGAFRFDDAGAEALRQRLEGGDASLFVEAAAAEALGRTRAPFAQGVLETALEEKESWADTIRAGCAKGLGALGTAAAVPVLLRAFARGKHPRLRTAAAAALAEVGRRMTVRDPVREALEDAVEDPDFRVVMAALAALLALGDEASAPTLRRAADQALDGRARRAARFALRAIRKRGERTPEVAGLADDVDRLKKQNA